MKRFEFDRLTPAMVTEAWFHIREGLLASFPDRLTEVEATRLLEHTVEGRIVILAGTLYEDERYQTKVLLGFVFDIDLLFNDKVMRIVFIAVMNTMTADEWKLATKALFEFAQKLKITKIVGEVDENDAVRRRLYEGLGAKASTVTMEVRPW